METQIFFFFFQESSKLIEFDLYFDLCWRAEIIQVGLNMHPYVDIEDASSSLWGSTSSWYIKGKVFTSTTTWKPKKYIFFKKVLNLYLEVYI